MVKGIPENDLFGGFSSEGSKERKGPEAPVRTYLNNQKQRDIISKLLEDNLVRGIKYNQLIKFPKIYISSYITRIYNAIYVNKNVTTVVFNLVVQNAYAILRKKITS